jgi:hypothetical protein
MVVHGNSFIVARRHIFVARPTENGLSELLVSPHAPEYTFVPIELPHNEVLQHHAFTLLESGRQGTYLHINHDGAYAKFGSVYTSDASAARYSLSLERHVRASDGQTDYERLEKVDGVIFCNVYEERHLE